MMKTQSQLKAQLGALGPNAVRLVLVSTNWKARRKIVLRGVFPAGKAGRAEADAERARLGALSDAEYRVLGPREFAKLEAEIEAAAAARRKAGAAKAAATRAKRGPNFILCNRCGAKSKKLFSEMGGLETRRCQAGHEFTYDRWIADRAFWNPIGAARAIYGRPWR